MTMDEARVIRLLIYALAREGINSATYEIAEYGADLNDDDKLVLMLDFTKKWIVYYCERGKRDFFGEFDNIFYASRFFYWHMTGARSLYFYREAFERQDAARNPGAH